MDDKIKNRLDEISNDIEKTLSKINDFGNGICWMDVWKSENSENFEELIETLDKARAIIHFKLKC